MYQFIVAIFLEVDLRLEPCYFDAVVWSIMKIRVMI